MEDDSRADLQGALASRTITIYTDVEDVPEVITTVPMLTDIGSSIPKDAAKQKYRAVAETLRDLLTAYEEISASHTRKEDNTKRLEKEQAALRKEEMEQRPIECAQALDDQTADLTDLAGRSARRGEAIQFRAVAIAYAHDVVLLASRLAVAESRYAVARTHAALVTWEAVVAATERYEAAKPLMDVDGTAVFSVAGRAYETLLKSHEAHRVAEGARDGLQVELKRQEKLIG